MADDVTEIKVPQAVQNEAIKDHLKTIPGRTQADGSSKPVFLAEGERRLPWEAGKRVASREKAKSEAPPEKPRPQETPPERPEPSPEKPEAEKDPPTQEEPKPEVPAEETPTPPKADKRIAEMAKHKSKLEEEVALLKQQLQESKSAQAPKTPEKPENWEEFTEDEQLEFLVDRMFEAKFGNMIPVLQQVEQHKKLSSELGVQLDEAQMSAVNAIWQGGSGPVSAQEAAALAAARDPELFGESSGDGRDAPVSRAEAPRAASPKREPKDKRKELMNQFQNASGHGNRKAAAAALMRHKLQGAFQRWAEQR